MQTVILLYGLPACGKYTIAKKLSERLGLHLVDNHFFNNMVYPYVNVQVETVGDISTYVYKIRKAWMDCVAKWNTDGNGFVFTNVLLDTKEDKKAVKEIKDFAKKLGYEFVPIRLHCNEDEVKKRINTPDRKQRFKLTDYDTYQHFLSTTKFLKVRGGFQLTTSNKTPDESAQDVINLVNSRLGK